jgi:predicted O-methyltransferase YrrM
MKEIKRGAERRLEEYKNKLVWLEKKSSDAVHDLPDDIDFLYIDGNHQYEYAKEDMNNYYPKVKRGGILAGHDIANPRVRGVAKAFCEFVSEKRLTPNILGSDWWVVKK